MSYIMSFGPTGSRRELRWTTLLLNLTFGIEVVFPLKMGFQSSGVKNFDEGSNLEQLRANLDMLEEVRE